MRVYLITSSSTAPTMTDEQTAKLAAYEATETVLDTHPGPLAAIPAAQRAITDFKTNLQDLRDASQDQATYAPQGRAKETHLKALTRVAVPVAQAVAAWAEEQNDVALADQIAFTRTDFLRAREQDALDRAHLVHDEATTHAADLETDFGITAATLTELDTRITAFADALAQPRHALAERSAHTRRIERLFPDIDRILTRRLDRLVEQLAGTDFYDEYRAARRIVDR